MIEYSELIKLVETRDPSIPVKEIYTANNTDIFCVDFPQKLIVKFSNCDEHEAYFQSQLMKSIDKGDGLTTRILYWETLKTEKGSRVVQVMQYLDGEPVKQFPDLSESKAIIRSVFQLHERLKAATELFNSVEIMSIDTLFTDLVVISEDSVMREAGERLLADDRYQKMCDHQPYCLIDGDLWPENLLIERSKENIKIKIIDLDPVLLGPPILQPAILFSSCFLVSYLMSTKIENESFDLDKLISYWPEPLNKQDVLTMMQVFPIALSLQKELLFKQHPDRDINSHRKSLDLYSTCLTTILALMD